MSKNFNPFIRNQVNRSYFYLPTIWGPRGHIKSIIWNRKHLLWERKRIFLIETVFIRCSRSILTIFLQKKLFYRIIRCWFIVVERSKDITHVKISDICELVGFSLHARLKTLVICMIGNSKLILKFSEDFWNYAFHSNSLLVTKLLRLRWVLRWLYLHVMRRSQGWNSHDSRLLQRQADFHPEIWIARLPNRKQDKLKG